MPLNNQIFSSQAATAMSTQLYGGGQVGTDSLTQNSVE